MSNRVEKEFWKGVRNISVKSEFKAQKMASYLNHTATTNYLCCVPTLEDSQELVV